jgi:hypothetical protein
MLCIIALNHPRGKGAVPRPRESVYRASAPEDRRRQQEVEDAFDELGLDGVVLFASQNDGRYFGDPSFEEPMAELNSAKP